MGIKKTMKNYVRGLLLPVVIMGYFIYQKDFQLNIKEWVFAVVIVLAYPIIREFVRSKLTGGPK